MKPKNQLFYFAYGSNLHPNRLEARIGKSHQLGLFKLVNYKLKFNKPSNDGSAKCNIPKNKHTAFMDFSTVSHRNKRLYWTSLRLDTPLVGWKIKLLGNILLISLILRFATLFFPIIGIKSWLFWELATIIFQHTI